MYHIIIKDDLPPFADDVINSLVFSP